MKQIFIGLFLLSWAGLALAQEPASQGSGSDSSAMEQKIRDLEDRIIALEGQVRILKEQAAQGGAAPAPSGATAPATAQEAAANQPTTAPTAEVPQTASVTPSSGGVIGGAGASAAKVLNPDISVIGDFIGIAGRNTVQPSPSLQMHESEIGLQAIIDPYARGDFFLSFGEQGVNLSDVYVRFTSLPAGFVARAGKMRAAFG